MKKSAIDNCEVPDCPTDPALLLDRRRAKLCQICDRVVYDCSASPGNPNWRRINACSAPLASFSVGDIVRIIAGCYEGFDATIDEINAEDHAALLMLHLIGRHVPFWMSMRNLRPLNSEV